MKHLTSVLRAVAMLTIVVSSVSAQAAEYGPFYPRNLNGKASLKIDLRGMMPSLDSELNAGKGLVIKNAADGQDADEVRVLEAKRTKSGTAARWYLKQQRRCLIVYKPGKETLKIMLWHELPDRVMVVTRAAESYSISGRVSGDAQAGVTVNLSGGATASATTDASGNYTFSELANGSYVVTPSKVGYRFTPAGQFVIVSGSNRTGINFVATQSGFDPSEGLVAYYPFEGNANDFSGSGYHGTPVNTPYYVTGVVGRAIYLQGRGHTGTLGDHVMIPPQALPTGNEFTIAMWVKQDGYAGASGYGEYYISFGAPGENYVYIGFDGTPWQSVYGMTGGAVGAVFDASIIGYWVHHVMTYRDGAISAFRNGVFIGSTAVAPRKTPTQAGLNIHWFTLGGTVSTRFIGAIDELRIYNRALTAQEVQELMQQ